MPDTPIEHSSSPASAPHDTPLEGKPRLRHAVHTVHRRHRETPAFTPGHILLIGLIAILVVVNQVLSLDLQNAVDNGATGAPAAGKVGAGKIVAPKLNPDGRTVSLAEYPTITSNPSKPSTGDQVQDAINTVIPVGAPFYAQNEAAGASFDDPLSALKIWGNAEGAVQLDAAQTERWNRLVNQQTCDYCCGSPNRVTVVNRCGCAHAAAARGISKFLVKYHGDQYSDEEILGESRRWQALFYPKGLIQNHMVFIGAADPSTVANQGGGLGIQAQFSGQTGSGAINLDQMPEMVGGC